MYFYFFLSIFFFFFFFSRIILIYFFIYLFSFFPICNSLSSITWIVQENTPTRPSDLSPCTSLVQGLVMEDLFLEINK